VALGAGGGGVPTGAEFEVSKNLWGDLHYVAVFHWFR
jgi:hypothetical protein